MQQSQSSLFEAVFRTYGTSPFLRGLLEVSILSAILGEGLKFSQKVPIQKNVIQSQVKL